MESIHMAVQPEVGAMEVKVEAVERVAEVEKVVRAANRDL